MKVETRPYIASLDEAFLFDNYKSVRWDEVSRYPWSMEEKLVFLQMQFHLREKYFHHHHADFHAFILLVGREKVGHYIVSKSNHEIQVLDIFVIPSYRLRKIATNLVQQLMEEAKLNDQSITSNVFFQNQLARQLYEKLGFVVEKEDVPYVKLRWNHLVLINSLLVILS